MLWVRSEEHPDNYSDPRQFLNGLVINDGIPRWKTLIEVIIATRSIVRHIFSTLLFVLLFVYIKDHLISSFVLLSLAHLLTAIGYVAWVQHGIRRHADLFTRVRGKQIAQSAIILLITILAMSPMLKTLTEDYSSDSVWTLAMTCLAINLGTYDYRDEYQTQYLLQ